MSTIDYYSFIPSAYMQEYARKTHFLSLTETVGLILFSSITIREKIGTLEQFSAEFDFEQWQTEWLAQPDLTEAQDVWIKDYLAHHTLTKDEIAQIQECGFPPLFDTTHFGRWKRAGLDHLAETNWKEEVNRLICYYRQTLQQAETLDVGESYCISMCYCGDRDPMESISCRSLSCIKRYFEEFVEWQDDLDIRDCYAEVVKWSEQPGGDVKEMQSFYTNYNGEATYLDWRDFGVPDDFENSEDEPHLYFGYHFHCRTPFQTGDIIEIDYHPFHKKLLAVFYVDKNSFPDNNTNYESFFYIDKYGNLAFDSVQHHVIVPTSMAWTRMSLYSGGVDERNKPLLKISSIIKQGQAVADRFLAQLYKCEKICCDGEVISLQSVLDDFALQENDSGGGVP